MPLALHRVKRSVEKWPNGMGMIRRSCGWRRADRADQLKRSGKEYLPLGLEAAEGQTEPVRWRERKSR